jgi:ATP-dependent DNA ligase
MWLQLVYRCLSSLSDGETVFRHTCEFGFEGIASQRLGSPYISGRSCDWLKFKNPAAPAVKREAEEDWGRDKWRPRGL